MARDLELALRVRTDLGRATREIKGLRRDLRGAGDASAKADRQARGLASAWGRTSGSARGLRGSIGGIQAAIATVGAVALTRSIISAGVAVERLESRFSAAAGGIEAGRRELAFVRNEAERLGIDFLAAADAYSGFAAAARGTALEGAAAREIFSSVAEAARVMGLSADNTRGVLLALEQIISKGTVQAEELRGQLGERLPGAFQIAARAMGVTTRKLGEMLARGEVLADDLLPKLGRELRASVADDLPRAVTTADAAFARLKNQIEELEAAVAESGILDFFADLAGGAAKALRAAQQAVRGPSVEHRLTSLLNPGVGRAVQTHDRRVARNAPELLLEAVRAGETISADVARRLHEFNEDLVFDPKLIEAAAGDIGAAINILTEELSGAEAALTDAEGRLERTQPIGKFAAQNRVAARTAEVKALKAEIAALKAALKTQIDDPAAAGRQPVPAAPATTEAGRKAIAQLERQLALTAELSREETARFEIEQGRYAEFAEGEKARILALARELDLMAARAAELENTKRREEEAAERRREALAELEAAGLALAGPYASARAEIEKWLEETLAALEAAAEGHEDYAARVAEAREIAAERLRRVDEEEAAERLRISKRWQDGVIRGLKDVAGESNNAAAAMEDGVKRAFAGMEDALVEFVTTGKITFSGLVDSILADIARTTIRQSIIGPLSSALSGWLGNLLSGNPAAVGPPVVLAAVGPPVVLAAGGRPGAIAAGTATGVYHAGGVVGAPVGVKRAVPPEVFAGARRYHRGGLAGMLRPDEVPIIAQRGERILSRAETRALVRPPDIKIEILNQNTPKRGAVVDQPRFEAERWVISVVTDDVEANGRIAKAIDARQVAF